MSSTKLVIHCITFNHVNFIKKCLDGFVMQKTDFPFQVYIADDCSSDGTWEVISEYAKKYPDIFVPVRRANNIGAIPNFLDLASRIKSEYVAMCEGDDFFMDENKLQKQVDFLEANKDFSICFHQTENFFEDRSSRVEFFPSEKDRFGKAVLCLDDLLKKNFIQTSSVMYRWRFSNENIRDFFPESVMPGDYLMHLLHAQVGKIGFIEGVMSAYRRHAGGIWWDSHDNMEKLHLKYGINELNFNLTVENHIAPNKADFHQKKTVPSARRFMAVYIKHKEYEKALEIAKLCPDVFEKFSINENRMNIRVYLLGFIPLLKINGKKKSQNNDLVVKFLGFIPILKIKIKK